jgi:KUP system potassium uptake protein
VLIISAAILFALFAVQSFGTSRIAAFFGPIMLIWFAAIAAGGVVHIMEQPVILTALNPAHGVAFLANHGLAGLAALGAVFLAVTGAEALYADLGHFGRAPIQSAWLFLVFPALLVNYLGQGALLLSDPEMLENPFFNLFPKWGLVPMIILATIATIIASQAVITGAYSVTQQAMQLGLLPRMVIRQTSAREKGQIYVPMVNWLLLVAVMYLTLAFRNSSALASAYGIAVTGTMVVTVVLAIIVAHFDWKWPWWKALAVMVPFLVVDSVFLGANLMKIVEGGWLPLFVGACLFFTMISWRRGAQHLSEKTMMEELPIA